MSYYEQSLGDEDQASLDAQMFRKHYFDRMRQIERMAEYSYPADVQAWKDALNKKLVHLRKVFKKLNYEEALDYLSDLETMEVSK